MQQNQLIWLAGSLLVLLCLAFVSGTLDNEISSVDVPALSISSEQIEHFEIVTSDSSIYNLSKMQGAWYITAPIEELADSLTVSRFTQNLDDMRLESVVTTDAKKFDAYGVGTSAKHLNISWGRNKKTFYVGNSGPDFQSFYVRLGNDQRVFLSSGRLNLPENLDTWRDKTLFDISNADVSKIAVFSPAATYSVAKTGSGWQLSYDDDESPVDSVKVAEWLNLFSPLKATAFLDDLPASHVKLEATHQIHFSLPAGGTQTIWIIDDENRLAVTVSGKNTTFSLPQSLLSTFIPDPENLEED
ncbi:MAG: DUF4340 domain-containing protein [Rhodothermales bacterium]